MDKVKDVKPTYTDIKVIRVIKPKNGIVDENLEMKYMRFSKFLKLYGEFNVVEIKDYDKYKVTLIVIQE